MTLLGISHLFCQDKHWKKGAALDTLAMLSLATIAGLGFARLIPLGGIVSYTFTGVASFTAFSNMCILIKKSIGSRKKKPCQKAVPQAQEVQVTEGYPKVVSDPKQIIIYKHIKARNPNIEDHKAHQQALSIYRKCRQSIERSSTLFEGKKEDHNAIVDARMEDALFFLENIKSDAHVPIEFDIKYALLGEEKLHKRMKEDPSEDREAVRNALLPEILEAQKEGHQGIRFIHHRIKAKDPKIEDAAAYKQAIHWYTSLKEGFERDSFKKKNDHPYQIADSRMKEVIFFLNTLPSYKHVKIQDDIDNAGLVEKFFNKRIQNDPDQDKMKVRVSILNLILLAQEESRWGKPLPPINTAFLAEISCDNTFQKMIDSGEGEGTVFIKRKIHRKLINPQERMFPDLAFKHVNNIYEIYERTKLKYPEIDSNEACDRAILLFQEAKNKRINAGMGHEESLRYVEEEVQGRIIHYMRIKRCTFTEALALATIVDRASEVIYGKIKARNPGIEDDKARKQALSIYIECRESVASSIGLLERESEDYNAIVDSRMEDVIFFLENIASDADIPIEFDIKYGIEAEKKLHKIMKEDPSQKREVVRDALLSKILAVQKADHQNIRLIYKLMQPKHPSEISDVHSYKYAVSLYERFRDSISYTNHQSNIQESEEIIDGRIKDTLFFLTLIKSTAFIEIGDDITNVLLVEQVLHERTRAHPDQDKETLQRSVLNLLSLAQEESRWGKLLPPFRETFSSEVYFENAFQQMIASGEEENTVLIKREIHRKLINPQERMFPNLAFKHVNEIYKIYERVQANHPNVEVHEACDRAILIAREARNKRINTGMEYEESLRFVEERLTRFMRNSSFENAFALYLGIEKMADEHSDIPDSGFSGY